MILSTRSASTRCSAWASRPKWWIAKQPCGLGLVGLGLVQNKNAKRRSYNRRVGTDKLELGLRLGFWELGTN